MGVSGRVSPDLLILWGPKQNKQAEGGRGCSLRCVRPSMLLGPAWDWVEYPDPPSVCSECRHVHLSVLPALPLQDLCTRLRGGGGAGWAGQRKDARQRDLSGGRASRCALPLYLSTIRRR